MLIKGQWWVCPDGVTRPTIRLEVEDGPARLVDERFLIDSGADRTVFCAALLTRLTLPTHPLPAGLSIQGIGGRSPVVIVSTTLVVTSLSSTTARFGGQFATFTDPLAADMSILGRDVLDHFDVIFSRRRNEVLLLAPPHSYAVTPP
jgi:hypothetical protein